MVFTDALTQTATQSQVKSSVSVCLLPDLQAHSISAVKVINEGDEDLGNYDDMANSESERSSEVDLSDMEDGLASGVDEEPNEDATERMDVLAKHRSKDHRFKRTPDPLALVQHRESLASLERRAVDCGVSVSINIHLYAYRVDI